MNIDNQELITKGGNQTIKILLYVSFILIGIINTFLGPVLPFLLEKWHLDDVEAGYLLAAQSLGGLIGSLTTSFLYSRLSLKIVISIGYVFIFVSLLGLSNNIWEIGLISSLLSGISLGLIIPTTTLVISKLAAENRAAAINLLNFFWALGAVLSPVLFLIVNSQNQLKNLFIGLELITSCFFVILLFTKNISIEAEKVKSEVNIQGKMYILFAAWTFVVTIFLQIAIEVSMSGWLPTFAKRVTLSEWWIIVPMLYWIGFLLSRLLSTFYLKILNERETILYGLILVVIGQTFFLFVDQIGVISIAALLVGFGAAPIFPTTISVLSSIFEKKVPELISYMFFLSGLSGMAFSWMFGYISKNTGNLKSALSIPILCGLVLLFLHVLSTKSYKYKH